ncbi:MAG TPA: heavy metal translocating P-type ATPase, partial [Gammaproteobacteria bacterium]
MSTTASSCTHCGLPLGCLGQQREVNGEALNFCCYGCCLAYQVEHGANEEPEAAALLIRLGVGGFLAMNIMLLSLLLYADAFAASPELARYVPWLLWLLATPLLLMLGGPFLRGAWQALRKSRLGTDALITLAALAAYGYSAGQVLRGTPHVYFDTATMVLLLFTLGRYLEAQARARTARSLAPILAAERAQVRIIEGAHETLRAVSAVKTGEQVRILPGERIGVDGEVVEGCSSCDETILTGQPQPQAKQPGSRVHAGTLNGSGVLLVRADLSAGDTRWIRISRQVRAALARKSAVAQSVDRVAAWFMPAVLLLAFATFVYWSRYGDLERALLNSMAVLVVACPCSLGLAVPLAATLGLGRAAQRGIVIRGGAVLEKIAGLRGIAFDKTGTLTEGRLRVIALEVRDTTTTEAMGYAQALARSSTHPIARASAPMLVEAPLMTARDIQATPGAGIAGQVNGIDCALGSIRFMAILGLRMPASLHPAADNTQGHSAVYLGWRGQVRARIALADALRPETRGVIEAVKARGLRSLVLSGDARTDVARLTGALGIDEWQAELLPETKVTALHHWQEQHGALAMVGDEMN